MENKKYEMIRNDWEIAAEINAIKKNTARTCLQAAVDIGRLLCEAKAQVDFGAWGEWLEQNVAYSQSTANNLMRLYQNYGEQEQVGFFDENRMEIFGELTPSQAVALLGLPEAARREYVETHDMEETSVRDIEAEIKARKEAEERADKLEAEAQEQSRILAAARERADAMQEERDDLTAELSKARAELQKAINDAAGKKTPEKEIRDKIKKEYEAKAAKAKADYEKKLAEAQEKLTAEEQGKAADIERVRKELTAAFNERLDAIRKDAEKAQAGAAPSASSAAVQTFAVHFDIFQREEKQMKEAITEIALSDAETAGKLRGALSALIAKMAEEVGQ